NGIMNVQFTMAVSRRWTDQGGQQQERTSWFRVTAWRRLAETLDSLTQNGFLAKGKQVYVMGTLEAREYQDQQGQTRTSLDVNADEVLLLGSRADGEGGGTGGSSGASGGGRGGRSGEDTENFGGDIDDVPF
ncbi:MAG TPA: single-stranded DNA-binding protein, partial [Thermomicrobiales bacterium]|nr:single-stranded DNA-binding protein [Thermomicrobiales bacterium]